MSTRSIQDHSPDKYVSMSFRIRNKYAQFIHDAARQITKRENGTASYMREIVINHACDTLGVPRIDVSTMDLPLDGIAEAAKMSGLSSDEFIRRASRELAATMLRDAGKLQPTSAARPPSGSYAAVKPPKKRRG